MRVQLYVFSGTGNTLKIAEAVGARMSEKGCNVSYHMMEQNSAPSVENDAVVGLAFPVAFFSSYPIVQRFIESLPEGNGRKIFMTATMGGSGGGLEGKIRSIVESKGYMPIGSKLFVMPGNYANKDIKVEKNKSLAETAERDACDFADAIMCGKAEWGRGLPLISSFSYWFVNSGHALKLFYKLFPLKVDKAKCVKCMRCVKMCPVHAIGTVDDYPAISKQCQSCQRCAGFCPAGAISVPGKNYVQYRAMSYEDFSRYFKQ
jgi:NAD-dependent dihydropyrimidine dehydrogenase PreA subunit/flavodoxin